MISSKLLRFCGLKRFSYQATKIFQASDVVCFDVDSTILKSETLDEFLNWKHPHMGEEIKQDCEKAMGGQITFQESITSRLSQLEFSKDDISSFQPSSMFEFTDGAFELVSALKKAGKDIFLISGGFKELIGHLPAELGLNESNLLCNEMIFDNGNGYCSGLDESQFTSKTNGKYHAVKMIRDTTDKPNHNIVMVGDGITDWEAKGFGPNGANEFICFTGIVARPPVVEKADAICDSFTEVLSLWN
eukprot:TRINITY_DN2472_c1_g1_i1.p1 TRINITY_DN2472_c1_g1~~TRINITY_DN2472_c1_g1_i1.p1  ORF type:complete len:246 (-),score=71.46 TRINITY_DN2472_c1_g1_i1:153-890(-)